MDLVDAGPFALARVGWVCRSYFFPVQGVHNASNCFVPLGLSHLRWDSHAVCRDGSSHFPCDRPCGRHLVVRSFAMRQLRLHLQLASQSNRRRMREWDLQPVLLRNNLPLAIHGGVVFSRPGGFSLSGFVLCLRGSSWQRRSSQFLFPRVRVEG